MNSIKVLNENDKSRVIYFERGEGRYVRKYVFGRLCDMRCAHEVKALERLRGLQGVQQLVERDSHNSFVSRYIPGESLLSSEDLPKGFFDRLKDLLAQVHKRGVADIDFAHSTDIIVTPDGNPALVDFASSIIYDERSRRGWLVKPCFDYVCDINNRYLINRKERFQPEELTDIEQRTFQDIGFVPELWRLLRRNMRSLKRKD